MKLIYPKGATPIDPDEQEGLILTHITTRAELNRWEQENIDKAEEMKWPCVFTTGWFRSIHFQTEMVDMPE